MARKKNKKKMAYEAYMDAYANGGQRRKEAMDSQMIKENPNAVANLPQEVHYKPYGSPYYAKGSDLNDTIRGVDAQIDEDMYGINRYGKRGKKYPQKY